MSDIVIKAENLGKKYIIGHQAGIDRYDLRHLDDIRRALSDAKSPGW